MNNKKCAICSYREGTHYLDNDDLEFYKLKPKTKLWVCNKCPFFSNDVFKAIKELGLCNK